MRGLNYYSINRTFCDVLAELRKCDDTKNYAVLLSLVEELQTYGNRMEASLYDVKDLKNLNADITKLKKDRIKLIEEIKKMEDMTGEKDD